MLPYKEYKISMVRKNGEDFEFLLSTGDWRDGDKEVKKMIISSKTNKIKLNSGNSPFKSSAADYF